MAKLPEEYKHEPQLALDGGPDGLQFVHTLLKEAYVRITCGFVVVVVAASAVVVVVFVSIVSKHWASFFLFLILTQAHLSENGILIVEVGGLRADVEKAYPRLPFTWLTTSQGDEMLFLLRKADFERMLPASASTSAPSSAVLPSSKGKKNVTQAAEDAPFAAALSAIAKGAKEADPALLKAMENIEKSKKKKL